MSKYKHFTESEVAGLDEGLCMRLDMAREYAGFPIQITSGYRTPDQNAAIGSKPDSAHVKGLAADLHRPVGDEEAIQLAWALGLAGFDRLEICDRHIHVDIDRSKPYPCVWRGKSK